MGAAVQFAMLEASGIDPDTAGASLGATSLMGVGALLALPLLTWPAIIGGVRVSASLEDTALVGLVAFLLFSCGIALILKTDAPLSDVGIVLQWLWNRRPGQHPSIANLSIRLIRQRDAIVTALGQNWKRATLLTVGRLGFDYLCLFCVLRATGASPRPSLVLLAYAATGIISLVPLTPGGLGIVEASLSALLALAGVDLKSAVVATLAYRLASYWLPLVAGPVAYGLFRRRYGPIRAMTTPRRAKGS